MRVYSAHSTREYAPSAYTQAACTESATSQLLPDDCLHSNANPYSTGSLQGSEVQALPGDKYRRSQRYPATPSCNSTSDLAHLMLDKHRIARAGISNVQKTAGYLLRHSDEMNSMSTTNEVQTLLSLDHTDRFGLAI